MIIFHYYHVLIIFLAYFYESHVIISLYFDGNVLQDGISFWINVGFLSVTMLHISQLRNNGPLWSSPSTNWPLGLLNLPIMLRRRISFLAILTCVLCQGIFTFSNLPFSHHGQIPILCYLTLHDSWEDRFVISNHPTFFVCVNFVCESSPMRAKLRKFNLF